MGVVLQDRATERTRSPAEAMRSLHGRPARALLAIACMACVGQATAAALSSTERPDGPRDVSPNGSNRAIEFRTFDTGVPFILSPASDALDQLVRIDRLANVAYRERDEVVVPHHVLAIVPEPETVALLFAGMAAFVASWRRSHRFLRQLFQDWKARLAATGRTPNASGTARTPTVSGIGRDASGSEVEPARDRPSAIEDASLARP